MVIQSATAILVQILAISHITLRCFFGVQGNTLVFGLLSGFPILDSEIFI